MSQLAHTTYHSLDATPVEVVGDDLQLVDSVTTYNEGDLCFLRVWPNRASAPDPATDPSHVFIVPPGQNQTVLLQQWPPHTWVAATVEPGVGNTAPSAAVHCVIA